MKYAQWLFLLTVGFLVGWSVAGIVARESADPIPEDDSAEFGAAGLHAVPGSAASEELLAFALRREVGAWRAASPAPGLEGATTSEREALREPRGWAAILTLHALADRPREFRFAAPQALASGVTPEFVVDAVRLFPRAGRAEILQRLLDANAGTAWPTSDCADVFMEAGDAARAVHVLSVALAAEPRRAWIDRLVEIDSDQASRVLTKLAEDGQWPVRRLTQVAEAFLDGGRMDIAATFFQAAVEREPLDRALLAKLHGVAPEAALAHARRLAQEQGGNPSAWANLGAMELAAGNAADAFEAYRQAGARSLTKEVLLGLMRADPERAYTVALGLAGSSPDEETLAGLARLALACERTPEAVDALLRAHAQDPSDRRWNAALVASDPARAAEVLAAAARDYRGRRRDEVVGALGDALLETGSAAAAFDRYREALQLDPDDGAWQRGLARSDPARAVPLLEARRRTAGDDASLLGALADAYAGTGRTIEARTLYARAIEMDGGARWYARLALVDLPGARSGLEAATRRAPDSGETWGALGDCCRVAGDVDGARAAYARASDLEPASFVWDARLRALGPVR